MKWMFYHCTTAAFLMEEPILIIEGTSEEISHLIMALNQLLTKTLVLTTKEVLFEHY
jgi:hypothetical protein